MSDPFSTGGNGHLPSPPDPEPEEWTVDWGEDEWKDVFDVPTVQPPVPPKKKRKSKPRKGNPSSPKE
jgi:hypothetical protein